MSTPIERSRSGGFTLVEVLVALSVMMMLMLIVGPPLAKFIQRTKLTGAVEQTSALMRLARIQAIKKSAWGGVRIVNPDPPGPRPPYVTAFVDDNRNRVQDGSEEDLGIVILERGISFLPPDGFAIFQENGAVESWSAIRFADVKGNQMEIQVELPATGKFKVCKYEDGVCVKRGQGGKVWKWK